MKHDGIKIKHIKSVKSIGFNLEDEPGKNFDFKDTGEQSIIKSKNIQNGRKKPCEHKIAEEDISKTINKIVDIAKEILLITERELPIDRK